MKLPLLLAFLLSAVAAFGAGVPRVPGEWLVIFHPQSRSSGKTDPRAELHASLGTTLLKRIAAIDTDLIKIPSSSAEDSVVTAYRASSLVRVIEPNGIVTKLSPNDAIYVSGHQNWYDQIRATQAFDAWASGQILLQHSVTVAVIDTGSNAHPELATQLLPGANFVSGEANSDLDGHGTFVAGIIAASTSNTAGMAGVFINPALVRILPVKVLNASGSGTNESVASGLVYAADQKAHVINLSLGQNYKNETVREAVNYALQRNAFLVAAAGNDDGAPVFFPAGFPGVFAVGAVDSGDLLTPYSNWGRLDLSAPGGLSAGWPACVAVPASNPNDVWSLCPTGSTYRYGAGTSFASPMVAATAALLLSQDKSRGSAELYRLLTQSADQTAYGDGYHPQTGWGRLNVYKALTFKGGGPAAGDTKGKIKIYNWPNPFNPDREGRTQLTFFLEAPAEAVVHVRDMSGDLLYEEKFPLWRSVAGMNIASWDGRNGNGRIAANGTYLLTVEAAGLRGMNRLMVLR